jgi:phosphoribosylformylglycinamidine cyclo-ligase
MDQNNKYELRGVSATKDEVHKAIKNLDKGLFPLAFCKVLPDITGRDDSFCNIMHADTAGTKTSLAYMYWKESGDLDCWKGIAQDSIVMNVDDMACVACTDDIILSSTIGRNKHLIPGEVISKIIQANNEFVENMRDHGVTIHLSGGETADVGDIVRTIDVGITAFCRIKKEDLIVNNIQDGDVIVGFSSSGQASYETEYNSGIGSNGLTSARHDVLSKYYADQYPESFDPNTDKSVVYTGSKRLLDSLEINGVNYDIGKLILSPTRTYLPLIKVILDSYKSQINGMIHCTGGGQGKVKKFIENKRVIKDNLMKLPPFFELIKEESGTSLNEMYQVFNMGHRLEIYTKAEVANELISIANSFSIDAQVVGYVENADENQVVLKRDGEEWVY